mgnify:CR=1 FL=1
MLRPGPTVKRATGGSESIGLLGLVIFVALSIDPPGKSRRRASRPRDAGTIRDKRRWEAPPPAHAPVQTDPTPNQEFVHVAA